MARSTLVTLALLLPAALALADDAPKPPSTGKELAPEATPEPDDDSAVTVRAVLKKGTCANDVEGLMSALSLAGDQLTVAERTRAYVLAQDCAETAHAWHSVIRATVYLLENAPDKTNAGSLIDAELALGDVAQAQKMVDLISKVLPSQRANLTAAKSMIACHDYDYDRCFTASGAMLAELAKSKTGTVDNVNSNTLFHMTSAAALGKYPIYETDIKWMETHAAETKEPPAMFQAIRALMDATKEKQMWVQANGAAELALGTYHLLAGGKIAHSADETNALVTLRLVNQMKKARSVRVTVEIPGVTDVLTNTYALVPGKQQTEMISPPLKIDFDVAKLRAARTSQVVVHIVDAQTNAALFDRTLPIQILPRDSLPLFRKIGGDDIRDSFENSAAWITPNAPEIDAFIKKAKARLGEHDSFAGEQQGTVAQVKALFDELKAHGVTYVSDPHVFNDHGAVQRTRLPAEVLASTNAQCLEGTLLYATLLEAIGLRPVMVFISGHVFVAWKPSRYDHAKTPLLFLETTMTGGKATFEQASTFAAHEFDEQVADQQFDLGIAHIVDVEKLRKAGYTPQPY